MSWFKRTKKGIQTPTEQKKDVPKGLWYKSPTGKIVEINYKVLTLLRSLKACFNLVLKVASPSRSHFLGS